MVYKLTVLPFRMIWWEQIEARPFFCRMSNTRRRTLQPEWPLPGPVWSWSARTTQTGDRTEEPVENCTKDRSTLVQQRLRNVLRCEKFLKLARDGRIVTTVGVITEHSGSKNLQVIIIEWIDKKQLHAHSLAARMPEVNRNAQCTHVYKTGTRTVTDLASIRL